MQRFEKFLILGEAATRLINSRCESTLFLFGLLEVDLGDFDPAELSLIVSEAIEALFLLFTGRTGS